jgi:hypothetical protein
MGPTSREHINHPVGAQKVENRKDPVDVGINRINHLIEEVYPVGDCATGIQGRERLPNRRFEGPLKTPHSATAGVDLLRRSGPPLTGRIESDQASPAVAPGAVRFDLVKADHDTVGE